MTGEERRKWLQRIRRRIADHNDIVYMQSEQHEEDCAGDCRVCQAEARYIDSELRRKAKSGEEIRLSSILSELLMDVELTMGVRKVEDNAGIPKPSIIYIQSVSGKGGEITPGDSALAKKSRNTLIDDMDLTVHLDSAIRRYGIDNTDELYSMLKNDTVNMKKKLRGGYRYLIERLKELGYDITEEMK